MEELLKELEELKKREFMIQMNDHWSHDDYVEDRKIWGRIKEIEKLIEDMEV